MACVAGYLGLLTGLGVTVQELCDPAAAATAPAGFAVIPAMLGAGAGWVWWWRKKRGALSAGQAPNR